MLAQCVWGGYPGSTPLNPNSGIGFIGNVYGIQKVLKTVLRAPFTFPTQFKVPTNRKAALKQHKRIAEFQANQSPANLALVLLNGVAGF